MKAWFFVLALAVLMAALLVPAPASSEGTAHVIFGFDHLGGRVSETPLEGVSVEVVDLGELKKLTARLKGGEARLLVWYLDNPAELCVSLEGDANQAVKVRLVFSNRAVSFGRIVLNGGVGSKCREIAPAWYRNFSGQPPSGDIPRGQNLRLSLEIKAGPGEVVSIERPKPLDEFGSHMGGLSSVGPTEIVGSGNWQEVIFSVAMTTEFDQDLGVTAFRLDTSLGNATVRGPWTFRK